MIIDNRTWFLRIFRSHFIQSARESHVIPDSVQTKMAAWRGFGLLRSGASWVTSLNTVFIPYCGYKLMCVQGCATRSLSTSSRLTAEQNVKVGVDINIDSRV